MKKIDEEVKPYVSVIEEMWEVEKEKIKSKFKEANSPLYQVRAISNMLTPKKLMEHGVDVSLCIDLKFLTEKYGHEEVLEALDRQVKLTP